jgi:hypothetical protein
MISTCPGGHFSSGIFSFLGLRLPLVRIWTWFPLLSLALSIAISISLAMLMTMAIPLSFPPGSSTSPSCPAQIRRTVTLTIALARRTGRVRARITRLFRFVIYAAHFAALLAHALVVNHILSP